MMQVGRLAHSKKMQGNSFRKGILHDEVTKSKISVGNKGKERSEYARQNYSKSAKIRGTGSHLQGKKISCTCCKREWDLGNFTQHIRKNKHVI